MSGGFARRAAIAGVVASTLALAWAVANGIEHVAVHGPWGGRGEGLAWLARQSVEHALATWSVFVAAFAFALVASFGLWKGRAWGPRAFRGALAIAVVTSVAAAVHLHGLGHGFPVMEDVLPVAGAGLIVATVGTCAWIARRLARENSSRNSGGRDSGTA